MFAEEFFRNMAKNAASPTGRKIAEELKGVVRKSCVISEGSQNFFKKGLDSAPENLTKWQIHNYALKALIHLKK